jgi:hypothetical protein
MKKQQLTNQQIPDFVRRKKEFLKMLEALAYATREDLKYYQQSQLDFFYEYDDFLNLIQHTTFAQELNDYDSKITMKYFDKFFSRFNWLEPTQ